MEPARDMPHPGGDGQPSVYPAYPRPARRSEPPRPPLTKRMRASHWIVIDCLVGGFAAVCGAAAIAGEIGPHNGKVPVTLLFMALLFVPVALRRRAPALAFGSLLILGVLLAGGRSVVPAVVFLAAAYVLYTLTVESRRRSGIAALALVLAVMLGLVVSHPRPTDGSGVFIPIALANIIAWMTGYSVRQRRLYVVTMQHQAASRAVADERLRIARELHDVVAHSMSVIAVQAGYGQYVIDASPEGAKEALGAIQATSRDALEEMRRMLGVLRQQDTQGAAAPGTPARPRSGPGRADEGLADQTSADSHRPPAAPLAPAPGLASLDRLISRTNGAGVRVSLSIAGRARPAPGGVDLSAYRIIQEALTNVVRHAGTGATCTVSLCYTDAYLVIEVRDDGGPSHGLGAAMPPRLAGGGSGHGIIGMQERVNLCGGTFSASPLRGGGFIVVATLPLPAVPAPAPGARPERAPDGAAAAEASLGAARPSAAGSVAVPGDASDPSFAGRPAVASGERRG